jgi:A-kinase anchor protein 10
LQAQAAVEELLEREHFPHFLQSEFNAKHQVDILTGGQVSLIMVPVNKHTFIFFTS